MEHILQVLLYPLVDLYCVFDDEGFSADEGKGEGVEAGDLFGFRVVSWGSGCDSHCSWGVYE